MAGRERYPGKRSEYGGGDGLVQRLPDGASLPSGDGVFTEGGSPSVRRSAMLMRMAGKADFDPSRSDLVGAADTSLELSAMSAAQRDAYEKDLALSKSRAEQRRILRERTNGYIEEPGTYEGGALS